MERFAVAMRGGRGAKRGPCAVIGCKDPESPAGQWNWLPPEEDLAGLEVELDPDAVCFCQKVDVPIKGPKQAWTGMGYPYEP